MPSHEEPTPNSLPATDAPEPGRTTLLELSERFGVPAIDLAQLTLSLADLDLIPLEIARRHGVLPLLVKDDSIFLAMATPSERRVIEEIEFVSGKKVFPYVAEQGALAATIERAYDLRGRGETTLVGDRATRSTRPAAAPGVPPAMPPIPPARVPPPVPTLPPAPGSAAPPPIPPMLRSRRPTILQSPQPTVAPVTPVGPPPVIAPPVIAPPVAPPPPPPLPTAAPPSPPLPNTAPLPTAAPPAEASPSRPRVPAPPPLPSLALDEAEPAEPPPTPAAPVVPVLVRAEPEPEPEPEPPPPPDAAVEEEQHIDEPIAVDERQRVVLVVDAEDDSRRLLRAALEDEGHQVVEAPNGRTALDAIEQQMPDLVVVDPDLPDVHGFELCRKLRDDARGRDVRLVVTSSGYRGWRFTEDLASAFKVDTFLEKPFGIIDAMTRLGAVLEGRAPDAPDDALDADADAALRAGNEAYRRGELDDAIAHLERGVAAAQRSPRMHYQLALLLGRRGDVFRAIHELERSIELQSRFFPALKNLAVLYEKAGFRRKAVEAWERAIGPAPDEATREQIKEHLLSLL